MSETVASTKLKYSPFLVVINVGSSTIKMATYQIGNNKLKLKERCSTERDVTVFIERFKELISGRKEKVIAVAHRLVAKDSSTKSPCVINDRVLAKLIETEHLAPNHNPFAISIIKICQSLFGQYVLQTIHSDSEFFNNLPEVASDYAVSRFITSNVDLVKKGFHGFAHKSMLKAIKEVKSSVFGKHNKNKRLISIQLGSGCSICAIYKGQPIDISMGVSTNEGLIMSNRSGDVDVNSILKVLHEKHISVDQLISELHQSSGLLGLTGYSGDMSKISISDRESDQLAINKYCYRIRKYIGAYIAVLGGVDCIIIGGGVGKNSHQVRSKIFEGWQWINMFHDEENQQSISTALKEISAPKSKVKIFVCDIDEEQLIAEDSLKLTSEYYS